MEEQNPPFLHNLEAPIRKRFPVGIIILLAYIGYELVTTVLIPRYPEMIFGSFMFENRIKVIYELLTILILGVILFGLLKRKRWARSLAMIWFGQKIIYMLAHFSLSYLNKSELPVLYQKYLGSTDERTVMLSVLIVVIYGIVTSSIVCWYVYSR